MLRGLLLSLGLPIAICLVYAATVSPSLDGPSYQYALRDVFAQLGDLYRQYPLIAAGLHAALFFKGLVSYRRRYYSGGSGIVVLLLVACGAWFGLSKMGMNPVESLAEIYDPSVLSAPSHQQAPPLATRDPSPPVLAVPPARPNMLGQHISTVIESIDMYPAANGAPSATGYLGAAPVVFELHPSSAMIAASAGLAPYASQPCEPRTSTLAAQTVSGCVAWVDDAYVGPVPLPRTLVFFTSALPENRVILGAPILPSLALSKTSSGMVTVRRKA